MPKIKASLSGVVQKEPVRKKTRQGQGRGSKPNHGRKQSRGQG